MQISPGENISHNFCSIIRGYFSIRFLLKLYTGPVHKWHLQLSIQIKKILYELFEILDYLRLKA